METFRRWGGHPLLAAGTDAAMAVDTGNHGAQRRQVDVVVGVDLRQVSGAERVRAVRTGRKCRLDDPVRLFGQSASDAGTAATGCFGRPSTRGRGSGRFGFGPFESGMLELSGVLPGAASLASSSAMRAVKPLICASCARIRAMRSSRD